MASVTAEGEAAYSIPLPVPPGTNGMTPALSLEYRHRTAGGLLGVGWSISGLSQIARCPRTLAQDGVIAQVTWTSADRFCLDGQRLVVMNGATYGTPSAEYRTEIESFARIRSFAGVGVGPQYFTVESPDGRIIEYGATPDSRIDGSSAAAHPQVSALIWALSRIRDRSGNVIDFSYTEGPGSAFRIASIRYNSNPGAGVVPSHELRFIYEDRPSNEVDTTAVAGVPIRQIVRLDRIELRYSDAVLRRYDLSYQPALSVAGRSRLASIQECAADTADCLAPTIFTWQDGTAGFSQPVMMSALITPQSALPPNQQWNLLDINGDGRADAVWAGGSSMSSATIRFRLGLADRSFGNEVNSNIASPNGIGTPFDFNGDARVDLLIVSASGAWNIVPGAIGGLGPVISTGIVVPYQTYDYRGADMNGDGLGDIAWSESPSYAGNALTVKVRFALPSGGFAAPVQLYDQAATTGFEQAEGGQFLGPVGRRIDLDGDGAEELLMHENYSIARISASMHATDHFDGAFPGAVIFDFNGDGCSDFAYEHYTGPMRIRVGGCGVPWSGPELQGPSMSAYPAILEAHDWNSDGREDLLLRGATNWHVALSNGDSMRPVEDTGVSHDGATSAHAVDIDGDGLRDFAWRAGGQLRVRWRNGPKADLLLAAVDGFGVRADFSYGSLTDDAIYARGSGAVYPLQDLQPVAIVARELAITDGSGTGSPRATRYAYEGLRHHLLGRGSLGFSKRTSVDQTPGERRRLEVIRRQDYPYTGLPAATVLRQESGEPIASTAHEWTTLDIGTGPATRHYPRLVSETSRHYQAGGTLNGSELAAVVRTIAAIDPVSGLTTDETTTVTEVAGGANAGATATVRTQQSSILNDTATWCLGRPQSLQMTASHSQPGGNAITRTASTVWDGAMCRPTQQRIEPGSSLAQVTYNLAYDVFGNPASHGVTGIGMSKRTTSFDWGARGQAPATTSNALSQLTRFTWNPATGQLLGITDSNGVAASWTYDAFGNPILENQPDGTSTAWSRSACTEACDPRTRYRVVQLDRDNTGATRVTSEFDFDQFDRGFRSAMEQPGGGMSVLVADFDPHGRVSREYLPYWNGGNPAGYRQLDYDLIGRLTGDVLRAADGSTSRSIQIRHDGHAATQTDALGRTTTGTRSAWGTLVRVTDAAGSSTNYEYDAFGNLVRVRDALNNVVDSIGYNARGLKVSHDSADAGYWTWTRNALGEATSMRDAKAQVFSFAYDRLGRLTSRNAPDGVTSLSWGNNAGAHNVGRLASQANPGFSETFLYDAIGRPSRRTIVTDATYRYDYSYDSLGLLDVMTYPSTGSGSRFAIRHEYEFGQLVHIRTADAAGITLWRQNARDAAGNTMDESLGAAIRVVTGFDPLSGALDYRQSTAAGNPVQDLAFAWDANGNLTRRQDDLRNRTEEFRYDVLDRLDDARRDGVVNLELDYDAIGNIRRKSDVCPGSSPCYGYDASRKHAVTSAGGQPYAYDLNGNMTNRGGAAIAWTSDNLPVSIAGAAGNSSQFWYGPAGNRWKQVATHAGVTETTLYAGELTEKVTRDGTTTWRQYVMTPTGVAAVRLRSGTSSSMRYLTHDHLGSTDGILDAAGNLLVSESFAPFGMRQGAQSGGALPAADLAVIGANTREGFTGHEHLDNLDLIHMNGRVYDPRLGRFISADPYVTAPYDGQSLNRYSYVWNNPLTFADPSGFDPVPCLTSQSGRCAQVTVWGRRPNLFFRLVGGAGYAQTVSASERNPCGQESSALGCIMQNGSLVSPSEFVFKVGTTPDPTLSGSAGLDFLQGAAARVGNITFSASPLTWLFGADSDYQWFGVPDSGAGQAGADFGDLAVLAGGAAGMIRKFGTEVANASPSAFARSLQGTRNYPHIDNFKDILLKKGTLLFSGFPGQSAFYTTASAIRRSQGSASALFDGLQVMLKSKWGGHRSRVAMYEVLEDTDAAFGLALRNFRHGPGGLPQVVVPEFQSKLRYILDFPLGP